MTSILAQRLAAHALTRPEGSILAVVQRLGGLQAQDFPQAKWALAVRCQGATAATVDDAFAKGQIARTWAMRGTLHVVPAEDVPWLVRLCAPRNIARVAARHRALQITSQDIAVARRVIEKVLPGQKLPRDELFAHLEVAGQGVKNQRGVHLLWRLAQDGVVCLAGEHFVLSEEWIPRARRLQGDEALGELATRYGRGHGPASLEDFAFWAGLSKGEARRALEVAGRAPEADSAGVPECLLLPGFDEYFLGYADRSPCLEPRHFERIVPGGNGVFLPMLLLKGRVQGTWRRSVTAKKVTVTVTPFAALTESQRRAIGRAARAYGTFHGKPVELAFAPRCG